MILKFKYNWQTAEKHNSKTYYGLAVMADGQIVFNPFLTNALVRMHSGSWVISSLTKNFHFVNFLFLIIINVITVVRS